jgi:Asp-tRNA(Asn)/Glu-tRNA(Gln) amidotransferase C subunit
MMSPEPFSPEQIQTLAQFAQLDLPAERVEALAGPLAELMERFEQVRSVDTGDREPPTITFDRGEPA